MRVMVTGATGFVGRALCAHLAARGYRVVRAVRRGGPPDEVTVGEIGPETDWTPALWSDGAAQGAAQPVDAVVHLAARVHVMDEKCAEPLAEFRRANVAATVNLARQAMHAGVRRLIFVSTVKVHGEGRDAAYRETDTPAPEEAYAISKWEAEQALRRIAQETGLEVVILRPPLVYGPGVKANFLRLIEVVNRGVPLPLGAIRNRRSLLYLGNLVDAIRVCLEHPAAAGQTFLLDDGVPVSTPELIRALARAMGRPARLVAVPVGVLEWAACLLGKRAAVARLTGSLWLDSSRIRTRLGWAPPYTMQQGLDATVAALQ